MTPDAATPARRSRWRRWLIGWLLAAAVLAVCGYGAWRAYDFRSAMKEAEALGWEWMHDDTNEAIRQDWKTTWFASERALVIPKTAEFERHARLIRRLAPTSLSLWDRSELKDLSALKGLRSLRVLDLSGCTALTNLDALDGHSTLRTLNLRACTALANFDALQRLPELHTVSFAGCNGLTNVNALKGLSALQTLSLAGCSALTNVDALQGLTALQVLNLSYCSALKNVDALKGLLALQDLDLTSCRGVTNADALKGLAALRGLYLGNTDISESAIAALKTALPNTKIFPWNL